MDRRRLDFNPPRARSAGRLHARTSTVGPYKMYGAARGVLVFRLQRCVRTTGLSANRVRDNGRMEHNSLCNTKCVRHANTSHTIMYGALAFGGASFVGRSSHLTCDCATGFSAFRPGYKRAEALAQNKQAVARLQATSQSSTRSTRSSPSSLCEPRSQHRWLDAVQHLVYVHLVRCSVHTLGHSHTDGP